MVTLSRQFRRRANIKIKMNIVSLDTRERLLKSFTILTAVATVLSLSGVAYLAPAAYGAAPADFGLKEGNTISATGSSDPDVYIVNDWGYKRLFLSPAIFNLYGHLGGFAKVKSVSPATRDAFPTSGLFQVAGDPKVYGLQTTGEDVAVLHWVNTSGSQAVADDPNFFKKVFVINAAEMALYAVSTAYTSVSQVPVYARGGSVTPTPTPPAGPLSVSVASDNVAGRTITRNASGVEYLKVSFSGTGTVNTLTIKRLGAGLVADFSNVFVYDGAKRLVSGKTFSTSTGETTFLVNVAVSGTKDITLVGDMTAGTAGDVNYISLIGVTTAGGAAVSGLPVSGNQFTISGASSGRLDVAKSGSVSNPTVGQKRAQVSEFKLTANTEAASVKRLSMLNGGTVSASNLTNPVLKTGTSEWTGKVTSDNYLVFDLGSGFTIAKGGNAIFNVYADVGGKSAETVILYFDSSTDLYAVGDQYGQGMSTASGTTNQGIDAFDTTGEAHTLTSQGGALTLVFNGPSATTISTQVSDATLLRYSMTAATNIEVRKARFVLCSDPGNDGTYNNAADETTWNSLTDVKVWNEDTNVVVMGPKDATAFDDTNNTTSCPDSATGAEEAFTDVFDLAAGKTYNFKVTGDVDTSLGGAAIDSDSVFKVVLRDTSANTGVTEKKYSGTTTAVAAADIVPRADIAGNNITISAASLTLSLAGSPASQTVIRGTKGVDAVGITFAASQASALKVRTIKLSGYASETGSGTYALGVAPSEDTGISVGNAAGSVQLYESETGTLIAGTGKVTNNTLNTTTGTITFSDLDWNIPAGVSKTLLVKVDLSNNTASGTAGDGYAFDIAATTDVSALDSSSNTINAGNIKVNGTLTAPTKALTVKNGGSMTLATAASSPVKGALYWGQQNVPVSKFRLTSTDEGQYIEKLTITASVAAEATDAAATVKEVLLTFKNKAGTTLTTTQSFGNSASVNFAWAAGDANRPYVPKDSSLELGVNVNLKTKTEGATQTTGTSAAKLVQFSLDLVDSFNGSYTNGFRAVGEGSGTVLDGTSANINDVLGAYKQTVYRVFPKIEQVALSAPYSLVGTPTVFKFSVTAMGLADSNLRFDNTHNGSGSIYFEVVASGDSEVSTTTSTTFSVVDEAGTVIDGPSSLRFSGAPGAADTSQTISVATGGSGIQPTLNASISFNFTGQNIEISGGQTRTFSIRLNNPNIHYGNAGATGRAADYFQVTLQDDIASLINWVGNYDGTANSLQTPSATGILRSLPLFGPTFTR